MLKTLHIASLDVGLGYGSQLCIFYSGSDVETLETIASLEVEYEAKVTEVKAYPRGFRVVFSELPGVVEVPENSTGRSE